MESLAVRHRPRRFADLIGQRHVAAVLKAAARAGTPPQQVLFSGPSGLGKTTVARIFAAALNCEAPAEDGDCCGTCPSCQDITGIRANHPDVIELDAASNGGKDEIREIGRRASTSPLRSRFKVYVIDEAHGISHAGGQAFLKLLEEPPPHVLFLLATTDPDKMLRTNRSRCVELTLTRPTDDELISNLSRVAAAEGAELPDSVAAACVAATDPDLGVRGTVMTLEKVLPALRAGTLTDDTVAALLGTAPDRLVAALLDAVDRHEQDTVLSVLDDLRTHATDQAARDLVLRHLRARAVAGDTAAAWRFTALGELPPGRTWTDIGLIKITRPDLDGSVNAARAVVDEAAAVLADLLAATDAARTTVPAVAPAAGTVVVPAVPANAEAPDPWFDGEDLTSTDPRPTDPAAEHGPGKGPAAGAAPPIEVVSAAEAPVDDAPVDDLADDPAGPSAPDRVSAALAARSAELAALVEKMTFRWDGTTVTVVVPADAATDAEAAGLRDAAPAASEQVGVPVRLVRRR